MATDGGGKRAETAPLNSDFSDDEGSNDLQFNFQFIFMILCVGLIPIWVVCLLNTSLESTRVDDIPYSPWDTIPTAAPTSDEKIDLVFAIFANPEDETFWANLVRFYQESIDKYSPPDISIIGKVVVCDPDAQTPEIRQYPFRSSNIDLVMLPCVPQPAGLLGMSKMVRQYLYDMHSFSYLVKVDADVVVNFELFFKTFESIRTTYKERFYAGKFRKDQQIFTDTELKKVQSYYPKYALSSFYILSSDLVKWLVEINNYNIRRTKTEATFVGLILSTLEGITYFDIDAGRDIGEVNESGELDGCISFIYCYQDGFLGFKERLEIWNKTIFSSTA